MRYPLIAGVVAALLSTAAALDAVAATKADWALANRHDGRPL